MLPNLQVLRAVAAYLVVLVHLSELLPQNSFAELLRSRGYGGVDIFFAISGFIMVYTTSAKRTSAGTFLLNRLKRIAPLYYLVTLIVFALALVLRSLFESASTDLVPLLKSLAFLPFEKTPGHIYPVYYLGWTLNYEIFFYAIFAAGMFARYEMRVAICTAIIVGLVV